MIEVMRWGFQEMRRLLPRDFSEVLLIVNNLVPVVGALAFGWRLVDILYFYVTELAVLSGAYYLKVGWVILAGSDRLTWPDKLVVLVFESAIFFFLSALAFVVILAIATSVGLSVEQARKSTFGPYGSFLRGNALALFSILACQGTSFVRDFLRTKAYRRMDFRTFSTQVAWRLVAMVAIPLVLAVALQLAGAPSAAWSLAVLILTKSGFDLWSHRRSNATRTTSGSAGAAAG